MLVLALQFSRAIVDRWRIREALAVIAGTARGGTGDKFERPSLMRKVHTRVAPSKRNSDVRQLRVPVVPARAAEAEGRGRDESGAPTTQ
jgi:hypothetical protein